MLIKLLKLVVFSALVGFFVVAMPGFYALAQDIPLTAAADKVAALKAPVAGFYQFNNLEIFKNPTAGEPPASIEVIQKNEKSCVIYENGKTDQPIQCFFIGEQNNNFSVQIDERTTLLGVNQEPALLTDFTAGDHVNVLGWLSADSKTIRAAVLRNIEAKDFHQSLSGTIKKITGDGFIITLENGDNIMVKTPIAEGAQVTVKGIFDKVNSTISNVLSILIKPVITLQENPSESEAPPAAPSAKPSTLFRNFLKVFGL